MISVCYGLESGGKPEPWSSFITNSFYDRACGDDEEDYLNNSKYTELNE